MESDKMIERFKACMVLHGVGDAMGYNNGEWEFNFSGEDIHKQLKSLGGVKELDLKHWKVSDDTVLHLANAECLIHNHKLSPLKDNQIFVKLVSFYKDAMRDMKDRAPGNTTINCVSKLKRSEEGIKLQFNEKGGGCGVSMRSPCIGLRYPKECQKEELIRFSVESGRMSHHNPMGYLGGVAAALFTSYAIQGIKIENWGIKSLQDFELAKDYVKKSGHAVNENLSVWNTFIEPWTLYLENRKINVENGTPVFPKQYGVKERDLFYKSVSGRRNWAGALGVDSVLIAYDALLGAENDWEELCKRAMFHCGDSDSTGCLAGAWFGALYGFEDVPVKNYQHLEYKERLNKCGEQFYDFFKED